MSDRAGLLDFEVDRRRAAPPPGTPRRRRYTREEIVAAVRRWAATYGEPPSALEWEPCRARAAGREDAVERFEAGSWPTTRMVRKQFDTFGDAVAAAGFERPRPASRKPHLSDSEEILRAIRAWALRYGEPPTQADWDPTRARQVGQHWRIVRYRAGDWPSLATARAHFGTLADAVRAAQLRPCDVDRGLAARAVLREANQAALAATLAVDCPEGGGVELLAEALRDVGAARKTDDPAGLESALIVLAGAALRWAADVRWEPDRTRGTR